MADTLMKRSKLSIWDCMFTNGSQPYAYYSMDHEHMYYVCFSVFAVWKRSLAHLHLAPKPLVNEVVTSMCTHRGSMLANTSSLSPQAGTSQLSTRMTELGFYKTEPTREWFFRAILTNCYNFATTLLHKLSTQIGETTHGRHGDFVHLHGRHPRSRHWDSGFEVGKPRVRRFWGDRVEEAVPSNTVIFAHVFWNCIEIYCTYVIIYIHMY